MSSYSPGRPPTERDMVQGINGSPRYLGSLVSTGTAVNNLTTAIPFSQTPQGPVNPTSPGTSATPVNMSGTLAGKVLLLQCSAAGVVMPSNSPNMNINGVPGQNIIALQSVMPPASGTAPGTAIAVGQSVYLTMQPTEGWLQWLPLTGSANLHVFESL